MAKLRKQNYLESQFSNIGIPAPLAEAPTFHLLIKKEGTHRATNEITITEAQCTRIFKILNEVFTPTVKRNVG